MTKKPVLETLPIETIPDGYRSARDETFIPLVCIRCGCLVVNNLWVVDVHNKSHA